MVEESHHRELKGGGNAAELGFPHGVLLFVIGCTLSGIIKILLVRYMRSGREKRGGDGLFVVDEWPENVRMIVSFVWTFLIFIPAALQLNGFTFGGLMALVEDWSFGDGYYYVIANFLGLFNPLTTKNPDTPVGDYIALVLSVFALIVTNTSVAFITMLQFVIWQSDAVPDTTCGLLRYVLLYIPLGLLAFGATVGGVTALVEDWTYDDGFLHMTGTLCAIANPIDGETIDTQTGMFIESYCACLNLGVMAMVITIVTQHPHFFTLVKWFEGTFASYFENRGTSVSRYIAETMYYEDAELLEAKQDADKAIQEIQSLIAIDHKDYDKFYLHVKSLESEYKKVHEEKRRLSKGKTSTPKFAAEERDRIPGAIETVPEHASTEAPESMKSARACEDEVALRLGDS